MSALDNVSSIFGSLPFFVGWILGVVSLFVYCRVSDWLHNRRTGGHRQTRLPIVWVASGLITAFVTYSTFATFQSDQNARDALAQAQQVAADAKVNAERTERCQQELIQVIAARGTVGASNDDLSLKRFLIISDWLHAMIFPPPEISVLDQNDPKRVQWVVVRTQEADTAVRLLIDQQRANEATRSQLGYPEPKSCGA